MIGQSVQRFKSQIPCVSKMVEFLSYWAVVVCNQTGNVRIL